MSRLHLLDADDAELLGHLREEVQSDWSYGEDQRAETLALLDRLIAYATTARATATAADVAQAEAAVPSLVRELAAIGSEHEPPPAWQQRVLAATVDLKAAAERIAPPVITDSSQLDWDRAESATTLIAKACYDARYVPPEALGLHMRHVRRVADAMTEITAALHIQPGVRK